MKNLVNSERHRGVAPSEGTFNASVSPSKPARAAGRHDTGLRRRAKRSGREKGCWVYIAAEELAEAEFASDHIVPWYRIWPSSRGGLFVRLYREK